MLLRVGTQVWIQYPFQDQDTSASSRTSSCDIASSSIVSLLANSSMSVRTRMLEHIHLLSFVLRAYESLLVEFRHKAGLFERSAS